MTEEQEVKYRKAIFTLKKEVEDLRQKNWDIMVRGGWIKEENAPFTDDVGRDLLEHHLTP
mgnify:CR=1 FL=1